MAVQENGTWQAGWGSPAHSTGFTHASITAMADGSAQLVAVTTTGVLMHNIRYVGGAWQGWGVPAQPAGIVQASITSSGAFTSKYGYGTATIAVVTSQGGQETVDRNSDGSWSNWSGTPSGIGNLGTAVDTTYTQLPDGYSVWFTVTGG
jgi:hypothetical protein